MNTETLLDDEMQEGPLGIESGLWVLQMSQRIILVTTLKATFFFFF